MIDQKSFYAEVGQRVRSARVRRSLSQDQVAERLGLSRASIANIENGRQKFLVHMLPEISDVLEVPIWELLPSSDASAEVEMAHQMRDLSEDQRSFVESAMKTLG